MSASVAAAVAATSAAVSSSNRGGSNDSLEIYVSVFVTFFIIGLLMWLGTIIYTKIKNKGEGYYKSRASDYFLHEVGIMFMGVTTMIPAIIGLIAFVKWILF